MFKKTQKYDPLLVVFEFNFRLMLAESRTLHTRTIVQENKPRLLILLYMSVKHDGQKFVHGYHLLKGFSRHELAGAA